MPAPSTGPASFTYATPASWSVLELVLNGTLVGVQNSRLGASGSVGSPAPATSLTFARIDTGTPAPTNSGQYPNNNTTPVAGDVLIAALYRTSASFTATPPAGWTQAITATGLGTTAHTVIIFWKTATSSDITGTQTFTFANALVRGHISSYDQTQIDNTNPILHAASAVSASDGTTATGPTESVSGTLSVVGYLGRQPTSSPTYVNCDFLNSANGGWNEVQGYRYEAPVRDQWHVGVGSGAGWV